MLYFAIIALAWSAVFLSVLGIVNLKRQPRLRGLTQETAQKPSITSLKIMKPFIAITRPITRFKYLRKLQDQAEILRINVDVIVLVLQKFFLAVFVGAIVLVVMHDVVYAFLGIAVGFFAPDILIMNKVKSKKGEIARIFPETVDLIDLCIGAGLDFTSSIKWVLEKSDSNPFLEQLEVVLREIQVGRNRGDALKDMSRRLQLRDISSFVRTVIQSERMGTSVEDAFRNLSEDTRANRYEAGERYAIKASLKILFPLLFFILPVILIIVAGPIIIKFTTGELIPKTF